MLCQNAWASFFLAAGENGRGNINVNRTNILILALALYATACSPSKEVVVVYSPHGPEMLKDAEAAFEAAYPEVDMVWMYLGTQDVFKRVRSESKRPQADVWWGGTQTLFMKAADEKLLDAYSPTWADKIDAQYKDGENRWFGTYRSPIAIVYNSSGRNADEVPQTWDELLEPQWNDLISIRKPLESGTMRTFIGAMILRAENQQAGINWLRRLHKSTHAYLNSPEFLYDHMKKNPDIISVWLLPDIALQRERNGLPLECVVPPETPVITEGIGLVANAPHPEWAKKFYEFVTTPEALAEQAHAYSKVPVRDDLDPAALPDWMVAQQIDALPIDWNVFAENEKRWCDWWADEVYEAR
jgi:iron(III) transport system substrate-binding protein